MKIKTAPYQGGYDTTPPKRKDASKWKRLYDIKLWFGSRAFWEKALTRHPHDKLPFVCICRSKVYIIPLTDLAEISSIGKILLCGRRYIAVRRAQFI